MGASAAPLPAVDCVITPNITVELSSPIPGALTEVLVDRSDPVERDQIVARMDSGVEQATVALARERSTMQAEIHLENVNLDYDAREQKRLSSLYTGNLVAQKALDEAERSYALTNWKLQQARDLIRLRVLEVKRAEELLEQKWIRSPIDGVVIQRYKQPGEYVEDQAILQIAQLDVLAVESIVPMELFHSIEKGMSADVFAETAPTQAIRAQVSVVDRMGDASSGTFGVRLTLPNEDMAILAGVKCTVQFLPDLPLIVVDAAPEPNSALVDSPQEAPLASLSDGPVESVLDDGDMVESGGWHDRPLLERQVFDACTSLGPIPEREGAETLLEEFVEKGFEGQLRIAEAPVVTGYRVLTLPDITPEESQAMLQILADHGVEDILLKGETQIALGVYSSLQRAERRQQDLADLDIDSRVVEWVSTVKQWWLDIEVDSGDGGESARQQLLGDANTIGHLRTESCQPQMAER